MEEMNDKRYTKIRKKLMLTPVAAVFQHNFFFSKRKLEISRNRSKLIQEPNKCHVLEKILGDTQIMDDRSHKNSTANSLYNPSGVYSWRIFVD